MIGTEKRSQTLDPKPEPQKFMIEQYYSSENPEEYIE
jgi:hypothetical protein